jgi:hypothetical protein
MLEAREPVGQDAYDVPQQLQASALVRGAFVLQEQIREGIAAGFQTKAEQQPE